MADGFRGMNALITGSSYGIGAAAALRLAAEGANVAINGRTATPSDTTARNPRSLEETAEMIRVHGTTVAIVPADLADADQRAAIVPAAVEALGGPIDILINNAAAGVNHSILTYGLDRRRFMFEVNYNAPIDLAQAVIPGMVEKGRGWIVNVSSGTARYHYGPPQGKPSKQAFTNALGVYGSTKAALNRITVTFAGELYGTGVRINTVEPNGAVASEGAMAKGMDMIPKEMFQSMEAMVESIVALCDCDEDRTGGIHSALDLLDELERPVMTLDGSAEYPGGYRDLDA